MNNPLTLVSRDKIIKILQKHWSETPARKSAKMLISNGFHSRNLNELQKTLQGQRLPTEWINNTMNEMRDWEILGKFTN